MTGTGVLIVDETADEKSSADAAGTARQYSGTVGGIALCQVMVAFYASRRRHVLIARALYLPAACAADEEHRELAVIPEEVMFATKPAAGRNPAGPRSLWEPAPPSSPGTRCTAAVNCAAASASTGWAMCWRSVPTIL